MTDGVLFTPQDAEEALALLDIEAELCPGCGQPKIECFDPANEWAYKATVLQCHACAAKERARRQLDDSASCFSIVEKREG